MQRVTTRDGLRTEPGPRRPFAPRLQRPGRLARLRDWLRGPPPRPEASRVFVAGEVRAVAWVHLVSAAFGLLGAVVASVSLVVLAGVLLFLAADAPALTRSVDLNVGAVLALLAVGVAITGVVAFTQTRAAVRLLDGDARGHRVLGLFSIVQTVAATAYLTVAILGARPLAHVVQVGLGLVVTAACVTVLHRWRPGSAGAIAAAEQP